MAEERQILVVSKAGAPWLGALRAHAKTEGWSVSVQAKTLDALTWLDQNQPRAIVIDGTVSRALTLCVLARAKPVLADVPILGLVPVIADTEFARWLAVGVDDVLPANAPGRLVERLRALPSAGSIRPAPDRGVAVVADTDPARCDVVGRVLAYAGYDVRLALDATRLVEYASEPDVELVIASMSVGEPRSLIEQARSGATLPAWVVEDPALEPWANPQPFSTLERTVVMSARAQPDAVLFASNALLLASGRKARGSTRLLYGTTVAFRVTGGVGDDYGYTFNISATGLFIRTLAPLPPGEVSMELQPPGSGERRQFLGEVIWNRPFGNQPGATTPPGFGVRLLDEPKDAMDAWRRAYEALAAKSGVPPMEARGASPMSDPGELVPALMKPEVPRPSLPAAHAPKPPPVRPSRPKPPPVRPSRPKPPPVRPSTSKAPEPPKAEPPKAEPPKAEPPKAEPPKAEPPKAEPPKAEPPKAEPPKAEPPKAEPPKAEPPPPSSLPAFPERSPLDAVGVEQVASTSLYGKEPTAKIEAEGPPSPKPVEVSSVEGPPVERGGPRPWLVVATAALGVVALGVGGWVFLGTSHIASPSATPSQLVSASASAPPVAAPGSASAVASAASSVAPVGTTSSAPVATACPQGAPGEGQALLTYQGYLIVCSSASLDVYAAGVLLGKTNEKLVAHCHLKFVRLGEGSPATWRTEGTTVNIACRDVTRVTLEPSQ